MYFCTLSDKKYLLQGLALYNSISKYVKDFRLCYLCLDDETYEFLNNSVFDNIVPFNLADLEAADAALRAARNNPAGKYGTQYSQYCWALTPYFMDFLINKDLIPNGKNLTYVDSDIAFYQSPQLILDAVHLNSIGIHSHRYSSKYNPLDNPAGEFNVGVVVIKNDDTGRACAEWWKDCLLKPTHRYYHVYGTCGDQKYLDLFEPLFGDVCVFDQPTRNLKPETAVGYLAPWCVDNVSYHQEGQIKYNGTMQPVVFVHFSHFNYDLTNNSWKDSKDGEWNPTRFPPVYKYYQAYFENLKNISFSLNHKLLTPNPKFNA